MDTTRPSLLIRVRNQSDQIAWTEFDAIYRPMLQRFGLARGLDASSAEEVAQQCMTAVHRYIQGFEYDPKRGRFKGWLRTMVNNRIRNLIRDRHEVQAESQDFRRMEHTDDSPEDLFDKVWKQEHLKHCLRTIRNDVEETTFQAFVSYVMEEKPVEQVCRELNMTPNQVHAIKSRMMKRVRQQMMAILGEEG